MATTKKENQMWIGLAVLAAAAGIYIYTQKTKRSPGIAPGELTPGSVDTQDNSGLDNEGKIRAITEWAGKDGRYVNDRLVQMTPAEVAAMYDYVFNYLLNALTPAAGSPLQVMIKNISTKYHLFNQ